MKLTEEYIDLCLELEALGYVWQPRPGDWMIDKSDDSIGMITTQIKDGTMLRRLNAQVLYGSQIVDLLAERGARLQVAEGHEWFDREGALLHRCSAEAYASNDDEESLKALVEDYRRFGA
ncbi:MAG: hypothetical protein KDB07_07065 [Planctomycetes bacterium]|nr:hypothetical protein [Planctomycetota bacterium]